MTFRPLALLGLALVALPSCVPARGPASSAGAQPAKDDIGWFSDANDLTGAKDAACEGIPREIFIKSARRTLNALFYIALTEDGRVCVKPIQSFAGYENSWQLLNGNGLVQDPKEDHFDNPRKLIAITADADELFGLSDDYRFYYFRWMKNPKFPGKPGRWNDIIGWPLEEAFYLGPRVLGRLKRDDIGRDPDLLRWGIGRRQALVGSFEDVLGRSHDGGGGLTSYYFLSPDGSEIYFSDSGLPADHSHTMCGPRRGRFVAKGLDVAASTMFVINERGEMFTRMADFDTIGSDTMFFRYSYKKDLKDADVFAIPAEDWLAHAPIPLRGKASITSQITITLSGQGNAGRELRVAGTDASGVPGYYFKKIFNQRRGSPERQEIREWDFKAVPKLPLDPARVLRPELPSTDLPSKDKAFKGQIVVNGRALKAEVSDFNLYCSPVTVTVRFPGQDVQARVHLVEEWFHLKRGAPGTDGTPYLMQATLELLTKPTAQTAADPAFKALQERDLGEFLFWAEGTPAYLKLENGDYPQALVKMEFSDAALGMPSVAMAERFSLVQNGFEEMARDDDLRLPSDTDLRTFGDVAKLQRLVALNRKVDEQMGIMAGAAVRDDAKTPFYITKDGFKAAKVIFSVLKWHAKIRTITKNVGVLIQRNDKLKARIHLSSGGDLIRARILLRDRTEAYQRRIADVQAGRASSSWAYFEDPKELWAKTFKFAERTAVQRSRGLESCTVTVADDQSYAVLDLSIRCAGETARYQFFANELRAAFMKYQDKGQLQVGGQLFLREKSPGFKPVFEPVLEGQLEIVRAPAGQDGFKYSLSGPLRLEW